ncbi:MAG TPA: SHOCT domain-containing protein [Brevibacterium sp.]|nr:SHOCT domain-containing protein [Brevibacterium sp.]
MTQKMSGVADMKVHVRRPEGSEIVLLPSMPDFRNGAQLINDAAKRSRHAEAQATNTHYYASPTAAAPSPPHAADDPMAQLQKLKTMHEAGLITEDEYGAKRAEILERL